MDLASVYVTCPDRDVARRLARALLDARLVACANLFPIESIYRWEGKVEETTEVAMFLKTRRENVGEIARVVSRLHPASVPCVVGFELGGGHPAYLAWVDAETRSLSR
jgi:periplasmic divalent cation tolerance protein